MGSRLVRQDRLVKEAYEGVIGLDFYSYHGLYWWNMCPWFTRHQYILLINVLIYLHLFAVLCYTLHCSAEGVRDVIAFPQLNHPRNSLPPNRSFLHVGRIKRNLLSIIVVCPSSSTTYHHLLLDHPNASTASKWYGSDNSRLGIFLVHVCTFPQFQAAFYSCLWAMVAIYTVPISLDHFYIFHFVSLETILQPPCTPQ